ncbi:helix-turn-helix transcriptional regulator [Shewanella frigidimarina]|jgi:prophage regulatory protein|uniref:helix-turn-helix transcriptional regulator n=1 Tax=Shewanella frigidimarina TaxID=56812 RepID=UPI003D7BF0B5
MNQYQPRIIRKPDVINETGLSKSTLYNRIKDGLFPPPISLGARAVGFVKSECEAVINAMIAEQTPEQIKALVISLVQQRSEKKGWRI